MAAVHDLLERGIPDVIDTSGLSPVLAAEIDFLAGRLDLAADASAAVRARVAVLAGNESLAVDLVAELDAPALRGNDLTAAAWAASRVGSVAQAQVILDRLADEPASLADGDVPLGPRSLAEGPLYGALGDLDTAEERLRAAVVDGDARSPLWGALARTELARVLRCRAALSAEPDADLAAAQRRVEHAALLFFRAGGHISLADRVVPPPDAAMLGSPAVGILLPGRTWRVGFGVMAPVDVPASKGLAALRHLVANPGRPVPASALDAIADGADPHEVLPADDSIDLDALRRDDAARSRIAKLLGRTLERLAATHPLLGAHLRSTISLGELPRYDPPTDPVVRWRIDA